jgi:hypothetical protein
MHNAYTRLAGFLAIGAALSLSQAQAADGNVRKIVMNTKDPYQLTLVNAKYGYAIVEAANGVPAVTLKAAGDKAPLGGAENGAPRIWQITFVRGTLGHELDLELTRTRDGRKTRFHVGSHLLEPKVEVSFKAGDMETQGVFKNGDFFDVGLSKVQRLTTAKGDEGGTIKRNEILVLND